MKAFDVFFVLLSSAAIALSAVSCIRENRPAGPELGPGDILPEFSVLMDSGETIETSDLRGSVSVIAFFNTDCPDCRDELPVLQKVHDEFGTAVKFVCISREERYDAVSEYWAENGLSLPFSAQEDRTVYNLFARIGIPKVYVCSPELVISSVYGDNPVAGHDELVRDIEGLLQLACL